MTRVVGIIPARYDSTRLPGKVLTPILGKPMIQRVYESASRARGLDPVLVATDDERVARAVEGFGGRAVMTSSECRSGTDRLAEVVRRADSGAADADIVVNVQGDQPFMDPAMIEETVQPLLDDPELPMATVMHAISHLPDLEDPAVVKVVRNLAGDALYFSRSRIPHPQRDHEHAVHEHVGLYAYRRDFLLTFATLQPTPLERLESLEQLRALEHGYRIRVVESRCPDHELSGFSVDTVDDLARAEALLRSRGLD
jgi:3-deoxy-manno-octulosonate cytidylyltransferase (CMP-KDO synthetase)